MTYVEAHARDLDRPADEAWAVLSRVGGDPRWWTPLPMWQLRGLADRVVGGPGFLLGGPGTVLSAGDEVDFWSVESADFPVLRLRALTRLPGTAHLVASVETLGAGSRLVLRSEFDPAGPVGHAYWWANLPAHRLVFGRLADRWADLLSDPR